MHFRICTLFPELFHSFFSVGLMAKAVEKKIVSFQFTSIRNYGLGKTLRVDEPPYGGGTGMLLKADVMDRAMGKIPKKMTKIFFSPRGKKLTQEKILELSKKKSLAFICGRYEGMDERVVAMHVDEEISIGDFVLSGGETAAMVLMESVGRLLKGFLGNEGSVREESFENHLLEHDQYTRPPIFLKQKVPKVLMSGDHKKIKQWKMLNRLLNTLNRRGDLYKRLCLTETELLVLRNYFEEKRFYENN